MAGRVDNDKKSTLGHFDETVNRLHGNSSLQRHDVASTPSEELTRLHKSKINSRRQRAESLEESGPDDQPDDLKHVFLEKIKEGMAQLLAEYTWPWYEQNVQLFRSLYNVHLVDDVAMAKSSPNTSAKDTLI